MPTRSFLHRKLLATDRGSKNNFTAQNSIRRYQVRLLSMNAIRLENPYHKL